MTLACLCLWPQPPAGRAAPKQSHQRKGCSTPVGPGTVAKPGDGVACRQTTASWLALQAARSSLRLHMLSAGQHSMQPTASQAGAHPAGPHAGHWQQPAATPSGAIAAGSSPPPAPVVCSAAMLRLPQQGPTVDPSHPQAGPVGGCAPLEQQRYYRPPVECHDVSRDCSVKELLCEPARVALPSSI